MEFCRQQPPTWFLPQIIFHYCLLLAWASKGDVIIIELERLKELQFYGDLTIFWFVDVYIFGFQNPGRWETQRLRIALLWLILQWRVVSEPSPFTPWPKFLGRWGGRSKEICSYLTEWKNCTGCEKLARPVWTIWESSLFSLSSRPYNLEAIIISVSHLIPTTTAEKRLGLSSELSSKGLGSGQGGDGTLWFCLNMSYLCLSLIGNKWKGQLLALVPSLVAGTSQSTIISLPHKKSIEKNCFISLDENTLWTPWVCAFSAPHKHQSREGSKSR